MTKLTLDQAAKIIDAAFAKGRDIDCRPLTVAVLDAGEQDTFSPSCART